LPRCSAHGLKKAGATLAAENGAIASQLMAMFDWSTISQAEVYTKAADRKRMAGEAMGLINLDQTTNNDCRNLIVAPKISTGNQSGMKQMAGVAGLEPATPGFGDRCSTN
jgi:hypothetical protein